MASPAAPYDLGWLYSALGYLIDAMGLGGLGLAWRASARLVRLEDGRETLAARAAAIEERIAGHDVDRAAIRETLAGLRESVARLPTRDELERVRQDLKQDFRGSRTV